MDFNQSLEYVDRLVKSGELDRAEAMIDAQIAKARGKLRDISVEDTWSPAASHDDGDTEGDEQDGDGQDDEGEEDTPRRRAAKAALAQLATEMDRIEKALRHGDGVTYPAGTQTALQNHQNLQSGTTFMHSPRGGGSYSLGASDVVQQPDRHEFDTLVDAVQARDHSPRHIAMAMARLENPAAYTSYQRWHAGGSAQQQETARGWSTDDPMSKLGQPKSPPIYPEIDQPIRPDPKSQRRRVRHHDQQVAKSFEQAVSNELARGASTYEVAAQRVVNTYGNTLPHDDCIAKGLAACDTVQSQFYEAANDYVDAEAHSPRCEALRKARLENPQLFTALQSL